MARAALDVNLVIDEAGDDLAESEQRLEQRAVAAAWATAAPARTGNPDEHDDRLGRACVLWGSSEGAAVARRATENAEGLGEEDRAAILIENAQALQDGAYAEAWL